MLHVSVTRRTPPPIASRVLDSSLLGRIHELNRDYLDLLAYECAHPERAVQLQHFPPRLAPALTALDSAARRELAVAPLPLYSLVVEEERFWRAAAGESPPDIQQRYCVREQVQIHAAFCAAAMLHAWHVANANPLAVRILYAMSATTADCLAATPLWRIQRWAYEHSGALKPRWSRNPAFWPELLRCAAAQELGRLRLTQLLGRHLMASDLEGGGRRAAHSPLARHQ